ncbi:hypothetical protein GWK47_031877 [Chionoecetes opilio]|uniref:WAP domain-containing protein n=1 Tax=Chionoecetes opilio TaxID=41210 RepID=A0A8J5D440_CHIOP|nr:hypothetical protein GWK47_031877 [Chionoecetes opilio]
MECPDGTPAPPAAPGGPPKKRGVCLVVLVVVMAVCADAACINYCPVGPFGNYECCDDHPGRCPYRPECPENIVAKFGGPVLCQHDYKCPDREKCCLDACIEKKMGSEGSGKREEVAAPSSPCGALAVGSPGK